MSLGEFGCSLRACINQHRDTKEILAGINTARAKTDNAFVDDEWERLAVDMKGW